MTEMEEGEKCHERYQQSQVTVLARFLAEDPDSGRRDYFISRNTLLDVTDLTRRSLRSSDPRVARLEGTKVQGASLGRTEIQVVSPLTGHVLGSTEVRVVKQRESVRGLKVRVVSGISLAVRPGVTADGTLVLSTTLGERLTSKYQVQNAPKCAQICMHKIPLQIPCRQHCCSFNHCGSDAESDQESANLNRRSIYFAILYEIARGEPCTTTATTVRWGALRSRRGQKEQTAKTQQCKMHFNKTQC